MGNTNSIADPGVTNEENQNSISKRNPTLTINNLTAKRTEPIECDSLEFFDTLQQLPNELNNLKLLQCKSEEVFNERKIIIKKLRDMADYLAKTHTDVLIADRVGTGVGIGSGLLFIGGLIAAPFTAGISLGLTIAGATTGVLGGITSAGANITGHVLEKNSLDPLKKELEEHVTHLNNLSLTDSKYLARATRFRPTLEMLEKLSGKGWQDLFQTFKKLVTHTLTGDQAQIRKDLNHVADPNIKNLLQTLPLPLDPDSLSALAEVCTHVIHNIDSVRVATTALIKILKRPEFVGLAMLYTNSVAKTATTTAQEVVEFSSVFGKTPLAMTTIARAASGTLTAVFIVMDVIHMVNICNETGETPSVQELRKMADDLEEDIKFTLQDKVEITKENKLPEISNLEREMEITALGTSAEEEEFFDCYEEMFFEFFYEY